MNISRIVSACLLFLACVNASAQRFVKVFDTLAALVAANPNDVHTNAFVVGITNVSIYTWSSASTDPTNANLSVLKAKNFTTGRWYLHPSGGGSGTTNFFETIYVTNLFAGNTYVSNIFVTNIVAGNTYVSNLFVTNLTTLTTNTYLTNFYFNNTYVTNINQGVSDNWVAEGTTNSTLPGIAKPWKAVVTNSVEVGQTGEAGVITLRSTNGTWSNFLTVDSDGRLAGYFGTTNLFKFALNPDFDGTGNKVFSSDGTFKQIVFPVGSTATNININPTDLFYSYRSNSTTMADGTLIKTGTNLVNTGKTIGWGPVYSGLNSTSYLGSLLPSSAWPGFYSVSDLAVDGFGIAKLSVNATDSTGGTGLSYLDVRMNNTASATNNLFKLFSARAGGTAGRGWHMASDTYTETNNYFSMLSNSVPTFSILPGGKFVYEGNTNVLYRSGQNLISTNGGTSHNLQLVRGSGAKAVVGVDSFGAILEGDAASLARLSVSGSGTVAWDGVHFIPGTSSAQDVGTIDTSNGKWRRVVGENLFTSGTDDGVGNFTRGHQSFTATTNGWIFNAEAAGTGVYQPLTVQRGGTNIIQLNASVVANETGLLLQENGTMSRVKIGAAGSGPGGSGRALYVD